jgi:uncharacterized membrane protein YsdA (DUF1294 family)
MNDFQVLKLIKFHLNYEMNVGDLICVYIVEHKSKKKSFIYLFTLDSLSELSFLKANNMLI